MQKHIDPCIIRLYTVHVSLYFNHLNMTYIFLLKVGYIRKSNIALQKSLVFNLYYKVILHQYAVHVFKHKEKT